MHEMTPPQPAASATAPSPLSTPPSAPLASSRIDGFFRLTERGTSIGKEMVAVATLIVFIALRGAGFVVPSQATFITMGSLRNPPVLLTLAGLLLTPVLVARRVPGALILSIAILTLIGFFVPGSGDKMVTSLPS